MKGDKFTADNPTPKPGKRTDVFGNPIPDAFFENESDEAAVLKSEAIEFFPPAECENFFANSGYEPN